MYAISMVRRFAAMLALSASAAQAAPPAPVTTWFHNDLAGSPVAATNEAGQVIWREGYYPFGERLLGPLTDNRMWFTSRRQDPETGLVYMGARYYDPVAGRFLQPDPVHFVESNVHSFNRYAYANNNPYRHADPDGRQAVPILMPPPSAATTLQIGVAGKPSHAQQVRALEGFASGPPMPTVSTPGMIVEVLNFVNGGGFAGIVAGRLSNLILSDRQGADQIASGHAFDKHVLDRGEFKGMDVRTRDQFASHVQDVMGHPTAVKELSRGRTGYWQESSGTVVINDPASKDGGTAFQPRSGKEYFDNLR